MPTSSGVVEFVPVRFGHVPRDQTPERGMTRGTLMNKLGFIIVPFLASRGPDGLALPGASILARAPLLRLAYLNWVY